MPFHQDFNKRDCLLPPGCKDLIDAIEREKASAVSPAPDPPITREVFLPEKVWLPYMAELSGADVHLMRELQIDPSFFCSIDFDDAAEFLRKFGILAKREESK